MQLVLIALGYASVCGVGASILYARHLQELRDPVGVAASAGMYAFGDAMAYLFIALLFMIPTAFLLRLIARFHTFYTRYSLLLLSISLPSPSIFGMFFRGASQASQIVSNLGFFRLTFAPLVIVGLGISRRSPRRQGKAADFLCFLDRGRGLWHCPVAAHRGAVGAQALKAYFASPCFVIRSAFMYGRRASGTTTLPSLSW